MKPLRTDESRFKGIHVEVTDHDGSAVTDLVTSATPDGASFRINGSKVFSTHAPYADVLQLHSAGSVTVQGFETLIGSTLLAESVTLAESGSAVTLDEEIDLAQRYLAIEQLRFGERLQVVWDLDPAASAARLPPLVLQPLVENAVRHGVEPSASGGTVRVRSRAWGGMAMLEVSNGLPAEPSAQGSGMALANVRERLRLLHDLAGRLHTESRDGKFVARIEVPL